MPGYARKRSTKSRGYSRKRVGFSHPKRSKLPYKYKRAFKTAVSKAISSRVETKWAVNIHQPRQIPVFIGQNQAQNVLSIIPRIPQGVRSDERIGRKIHPKSLVVKGFVSMDMSQTNADDYDRLGIRIYVLRAKQYGNVADAQLDIMTQTNNWTTEMMTDGALVAPWIGARTDWNLRPNPGVVNVLATRSFFLTRPRMLSNAGGRYSGNSIKFFKIKVPCPKGFTYEDTQANLPLGFAPMICVGGVLLNGTVPSTVSPVLAMYLSTTSTLYYEDA